MILCLSRKYSYISLLREYGDFNLGELYDSSGVVLTMMVKILFNFCIDNCIHCDEGQFFCLPFEFSELPLPHRCPGWGLD